MGNCDHIEMEGKQIREGGNAETTRLQYKYAERIYKKSGAEDSEGE